MPEMDGYEVARYARENPVSRDIPIIFVTAMQENIENLLTGYESGAVDYLFKPVNAVILRSKVRVFIELSRSRQSLTEEIEAHKKTLAELEAFNYSVSHDLRSPLGALFTYSQILFEDYGPKLDAKAKNYLRHIQDSARSMSQLIEDLLRLSRTGHTTLNVSTVDLVEIAQSIITQLRLNSAGRDVLFTSVPEAKVNGDPRLLRVALENLLRNAWKFTKKQPSAQIEFGVLEQKGKPVFFIRDNGAGFNQEEADKLFQPFSRLHSEQDFEGTGIGLAIVSRVIERHQGRVWAESKPGEGATFYFTIAENRPLA
jgi:signal transduction histidine kinase